MPHLEEQNLDENRIDAFLAGEKELDKLLILHDLHIAYKDILMTNRVARGKDNKWRQTESTSGNY